MFDPTNLDFSSLTFHEFVRFFFDHDIATEENWALAANYCWPEESRPASPSAIVEHMTRLFGSFAEVASRYSLPQINAGIWAMLGEPFRLQEYLWNRTVPLSRRLTCVGAMYSVYAEFVSKSQEEMMENCFDMWWDFVAEGFWANLRFERKVRGGDLEALDGDSRALLDTMFDTLKRILELPDARTQGYALHGLGHLHHPGVRQLVQAFIDKHRQDFSEDGLRWAKCCRDGTVM